MTTAATSLLGLALPVTGELSGTWGDTVNNSITALLDNAVAGTTTLTLDIDATLTTTELAANQARQAVILLTGARTGIRTVTAPAKSKTYVVINNTTGGFVTYIKSPSTSGVAVSPGTSAFVAWNGTDFTVISTSVVSNTSVSNDITTATNLYPTFAGVTTGFLSNLYTGNTKLLYKPSTGEFQSSATVSSNGISINANVVAANYTIASGNNGLSAGPITVASGITVTIASGSAWVVVG
jgi:hypothetical protein